MTSPRAWLALALALMAAVGAVLVLPAAEQPERGPEVIVIADPLPVGPTPEPGPTEVVSPVPVDVSPPNPLISGIASWMPEKYGPTYLALPQGPGFFVRICGATCVELESMDTGPNQRIHPDRVADLAVVLWEQVCGVPRAIGLCPVTVELMDSIEGSK